MDKTGPLDYNFVMSSRIEEKKEQKRHSLLASAFSLLASREIQDISVSDITQSAGVAKGTFYLFFKDKYELADCLVAREASKILARAQSQLEACDFHHFEDGIIFFIQDILRQLQTSPMLMRLIRRNLSFGVFHRHLQSVRIDSQRDLCDGFRQFAEKCGYYYKDPRMVFYMILELTGSVCYGALVDQVPGPIETVQPALFQAIRAILSSAARADRP